MAQVVLVSISELEKSGNSNKCFPKRETSRQNKMAFRDGRELHMFLADTTPIAAVSC